MSLFALSNPLEQEIAQAVADAVEAATEAASSLPPFDPASWVLDMTALGLCREVSDELGEPLDEVWHILCNVPPNMVCLFDSPEGWGVVANHVALHLGHSPLSYRPVVH